MKKYWSIRIVILVFGLQFAGFAQGADLSGIWTKTTDPAADNIALFYIENNTIRAIGYSRVQEKKVLWFAEGKIKAAHVQCFYHYSADAMPAGWEQEGTMELTLSEDGNVMGGTAKSVSGAWSGAIEFRRIQLVSPDIGN
jgi:hypothetical protein